MTEFDEAMGAVAAAIPALSAAVDDLVAVIPIAVEVIERWLAEQ